MLALPKARRCASPTDVGAEAELPEGCRTDARNSLDGVTPAMRGIVHNPHTVRASSDYGRFAANRKGAAHDTLRVMRTH